MSERSLRSGSVRGDRDARTVRADGSALDQGGLALGWEDTEWSAAPLHPVAHWVLMPTSGGRSQLEMVWEVPDPIPPAITR